MTVLAVEEPLLVHALPGRLRLRVPGWSGGDRGLVEAHMRQVPGVRDVQANPLTHNVLIRFDPSATSVVTLLATLRRINLGPVLREPHARPGPGIAPRGCLDGRATGVLVETRSDDTHVRARPGWSPTPPGAGKASLGHLACDVLILLARLAVRGGPLALLLEGVEVVRLLTALAEWLARDGRPDSPSRTVHPDDRVQGAAAA